MECVHSCECIKQVRKDVDRALEREKEGKEIKAQYILLF